MEHARVLIAGGPFGARLSAERVLAEIDGGLRAGGLAGADLCPLAGEPRSAAELAATLAAAHFDARMRRARALVLASARLLPDELLGSVAFELATRARQAGVPAYAVARESALDAFQARMLDLQLIIEARGAASLARAGRELARVI